MKLLGVKESPNRSEKDTDLFKVISEVISQAVCLSVVLSGDDIGVERGGNRFAHEKDSFTNRNGASKLVWSCLGHSFKYGPGDASMFDATAYLNSTSLQPSCRLNMHRTKRRLQPRTVPTAEYLNSSVDKFGLKWELAKNEFSCGYLTHIHYRKRKSLSRQSCEPIEDRDCIPLNYNQVNANWSTSRRPRISSEHN